MSVPPPMPIAAAALAGCAVGIAYFGALWIAVRRHVEGRDRFVALALHVGRFALLGGGFWIIAQQGAPSLIAGLGGFVVARQIAVSTIRSRRC